MKSRRLAVIVATSVILAACTTAVGPGATGDDQEGRSVSQSSTSTQIPVIETGSETGTEPQEASSEEVSQASSGVGQMTPTTTPPLATTTSTTEVIPPTTTTAKTEPSTEDISDLLDELDDLLASLADELEALDDDLESVETSMNADEGDIEQ